jgi:hypothetical protein
VGQARALFDTLWGVALEPSDDHAVVSGFDQFTAWRIGLYAVLTILFTSVLVFGTPGDNLRLALVLAMLAAPMVLLTQFFRFKLVISAAGVDLQRSWAGIRYRHKHMELRSTRFEVWGTGDWGSDGGWPIREFCEIMPNGRSLEECIGTPNTAGTIALFCNLYRDKFANNAQLVV